MYNFQSILLSVQHLKNNRLYISVKQSEYLQKQYFELNWAVIIIEQL